MITSWLPKTLTVLYLCAFSMQEVNARSGSGQAEQVDPKQTALLEQLRADYAALLDASIDFEQIENSPGASTQEQADYADWIQQLSEQFASDCREFSDNSTATIPADIPCGEFGLAYTEAAEIDTENESSHGEQIAAHVSKFDQSLGNFDEKLLREQDRVKARRPQASAADSGGSAGGGGSNTGGGQGSGAESGESDDGVTEGAQPNETTSAAGEGGDRDTPSTKGNPTNSSAPPNTPSGQDDDVIARQLREAAEKETDPELKKKLWEEYKRYKEGL